MKLLIASLALAAAALAVLARLAPGDAQRALGAGHEPTSAPTVAAVAEAAPAPKPGTSETGASPPAASTASLAVHELELQMLAMINRDRQNEAGAPALIWDDELAAVAREHSEDMVSAHYFGHAGTDGSTPMTRTTRAGIGWQKVGENVALYPGFVDKAGPKLVAESELMLMHSPGHRRNLLDAEFTRVGVGIARSPTNEMLTTQLFARFPND